MRDGAWKLVRSGATWELYDLATDRTEMRDLASKRTDLIKQMDTAWLAWWKGCTGSEWTGKNTKERDLEP
jgi:arylsulfatase